MSGLSRTQGFSFGMRWTRRTSVLSLVILALSAAFCARAGAQEESASGMPTMGDVMKVVEKAQSESGSDLSTPIKVAVFFTVLAVLPSLLVMMTSFTRIVIVLSFVRRALTTQSIPPTIAIVGLALFLTMFTMAPTFSRIQADAVEPYLAGESSFESASKCAAGHMREFMLGQTRRSAVQLFVDLAKIETPETASDLPVHVVVPAFIVSEMRTAFEMGFLVFIPFLVVDLVIASILLSTGMMMLPPVIISMPFKILLFILVDGWALLARSLVQSFM